jgi:gliding motility-associated-like protein
VKFICTLFILFGLSHLAKSQNLIPNPGFEFSLKPVKSRFSGNIDWAAPWFPAGKGSPDLISNSEVPYGKQKAAQGNQFAGIVLYDQDNAEFREYLEVKLIRALRPDEKICLRLKVSAADRCRYFTDALGFALSQDSLLSSSWTVIRREPELNTRQFDAISDTSEAWKLLEFNYTARGGEKYLTIGNFKNDASTGLLGNFKEAYLKIAYLYIDDLFLGPCQEADSVNNEIQPIQENLPGGEELPASKLHIPNVVTPNGDGFNDVFFIYGLPRYARLTIYDQKGKKVFFTNNYRNDWDGSGLVSGNYRYELALPDGNIISGPVDVLNRKLK